jgi:hypothetical protein
LGNQANEWAKKEMKRLRKARGGKCETKGCNQTKDLQFSHTKYTPILNAKFRSGRKERITDIRKYPKAYKLKCRKHNLNMRYRKGRRKKQKTKSKKRKKK